MHEKYTKLISDYTETIKEKLMNGEEAITQIENIYNLLETQLSYNKFIQICKYIFAKNNIGFDLSVNGKNQIFFIFRYIKRNEFKIYMGEGVCSLCEKDCIGSEHHIKPRRFGGKNNKRNLVFLCFDCHNAIELFCSYCENSKTICDRQMFNSCWRRNNAYFLQTEYSKDMFSNINEIPRFNVEKRHKQRKIRTPSNKCMICKKTFTFPLNRCIIKSDTIFKMKKSILQDKSNKDIIYMCDACYDYAIMWEKAYSGFKDKKRKAAVKQAF